jgi:hypothetical protein
MTPSTPDDAQATDGSDGISLGHGGGFTGAYTSFSLGTDGSVAVRESMLGTSKVLRRFAIDGARVERWLQELDAAGFFDLDYDRPGNMSEFFEATRRGRFRRVSWAMNASPPPSLATIWREIRAVIGLC